jgi:hypothetical protein
MTLFISSALLGLAWFAAIGLASTAAAWVLGRLMLRAPTSSPALVLGVRLLPAAAACAFVLAIFLPAHWRFEPARTDESFGVVLGALAAFAFGLLARSAWRALRLGWREYRLSKLTERTASPLDVGAFEVGGLPGVSLAGILRPRILVGSDALATLSPAELDVAISHELAHRRSRDNLKRCLIFCAPDVFGWTAVARRLEERWQAESECQADARAVQGEDHRAVVLASALVKVARLTQRRNGIAPSPAWSAFHVASLLETRVRRLVAGQVAVPAGMGKLWVLVALVTIVVAASVGLSDLSVALHTVTESMVANLP